MIAVPKREARVNRLHGRGFNFRCHCGHCHVLRSRLDCAHSLPVDSRRQKKAEANAPIILDQAFVGDDVVFKINPASPRFRRILGAKARGYSPTNETNDSAKTLIFERIQ